MGERESDEGAQHGSGLPPAGGTSWVYEALLLTGILLTLVELIMWFCGPR